MPVPAMTSDPWAPHLTGSQEYFRQVRWQGYPHCPRCQHQRLHRLRRQRFRCGRCRYEFGEFTGTYLGQLRLPLELVIHLLSLFSRGVPAYRVRWHVPVSRPTVERAFRLFRQAIYDAAMEELRQLQLSGELELDETALGSHRRGKGGWSAVGNAVVFGISQRNGQVVTFPVSRRRRLMLARLIASCPQDDGIDPSDDFHAYVILTLQGKHQQVTHTQEQFVRGPREVSDVEDFWRYAKGWLSQYRGVPRRYFPLYLKEIEWRFNHQHEDLFPLLAQLVVRPVATL